MLDAIVIGTGFGGAVSACRLAQAGLSVKVLERGRRYPRGSFPRDWKNPKNGWLWEHGQGLFDVKPLNEMTIVQGAGYGGGSLIYANVHLRPVPAVFERGWPAGYGRALLDPYYDLAAYMLDIRPITAAPQGLPPKTQLMRKVAQDLGRAEQFCYPNLAVDFSPPGQDVLNKHGVTQSGCTYCGECDIGCNVHAKNTLDLNYLAIAERAGARVATQCEVFQIEPLSSPAGGYRVRYHDHAAGGASAAVEARTVFLCAGAVNSTELLLRCRDQHRSLPGLGEALGERYSGNGDLLAFAFETAQRFDPSVGPTITTGIVVDEGAAPGASWFIFEEGGCPQELTGLLQVLDPGSDLARQAGLLRDELAFAWRSRAEAMVPSPASEEGRRSAVFLAMGRDRANGHITLGQLGNLFVKWDVPSNLPLYDLQERVAADVARALGGKVAGEPLWERLRLPVSVHNLGGCVMSDDARGVTDAQAEARGYPGLYVMDGGALPEATGVNPSHTIAAVAERNVELAIRKLTGRRDWVAPERKHASPIVDPVSRLTIPAGGTRPPATPSVGLSFSESLHGHHAAGFVPDNGAATRDTFIAAATAGKEAGRRLEVAITITASNVERFLAEASHAALLTGRVRVDGFTSADGADVIGGTFNLYAEAPGSTTHRLQYLMPFIGADGKDYLLDGEADVVGADGGFHPLATSTVYACIRAGKDRRSGTVVSAGVFRLGAVDLVKEVASISVTGTDSLARKRDVVLRFFKAFMGPVAATALARLKLDA